MVASHAQRVSAPPTSPSSSSPTPKPASPTHHPIDSALNIFDLQAQALPKVFSMAPDAPDDQPATTSLSCSHDGGSFTRRRPVPAEALESLFAQSQVVSVPDPWLRTARPSVSAWGLQSRAWLLGSSAALSNPPQSGSKARHSRHIPKKTGNICSQKNLYLSVHKSPKQMPLRCSSSDEGINTRCSSHTAKKGQKSCYRLHLVHLIRATPRTDVKTSCEVKETRPKGQYWMT
nr:uncharacterized protein LOC101434459 [Dasypus novemcinctus]